MTDPRVNPALTPPGVAGPAAAPPPPPKAPPVTGKPFSEVLAERTNATQSVQFSKHARQRVERRGIDLDGSTVNRLNDGVARAADKGSREAVVFVDGNAFVVAVNNKTVVTAVDQQHMKDHVFTNIDSAVIA